jgi:hypothetical protein
MSGDTTTAPSRRRIPKGAVLSAGNCMDGIGPFVIGIHGCAICVNLGVSRCYRRARA